MKKTLTIPSFSFFPFILIVAYAMPAWAGSSIEQLIEKGGDAVLQEADQRANAAAEITRHIKMTMQGEDGETRELKMEQITKDGKGTAIRFSKPADIKGMAMVIKGNNEIYVKLPGTSKVRRVAAHARKQGFQGTDFSLDDLKMLRFAPDYSAKVLKVDHKTVELDLTRKPDSDLPYSRMLMTLDKDILIPKAILYFDNDGNKIKHQTRSGLGKLKNGQPTYRRIKMKDLIRNHTTEITVMKEIVGKRIPNKTFSKRWLVRGT